MTLRRTVLSASLALAALLVGASAEWAAAQSCTDKLQSVCLQRQGAGSIPVGGADCNAQWDAYRGCLLDIAASADAAPSATPTTAASTAAASTAGPGPTCDLQTARELWNDVKGSESCAQIGSFRRACPNAPQAFIAEGLMQDLNCAAPTTVAARAGDGAPSSATEPAAPATDASAAAKPNGEQPASGDGERRVGVLAREGDWAVAIDGEGIDKACWIVTQPVLKRVEKDGRLIEPKRGDVFLMVSRFAKTKALEEVSVRFGFEPDSSKKVFLNIDGKRFPMFTQDDGGWLADAKVDAQAKEAFIQGRSAEIVSVTEDGAEVTDIYSLAGFARAFTEMTERCEI
ncbi:MAG: hypothetical protein AAFW46_04235 [Pseudomonadota bacterium]